MPWTPAVHEVGADDVLGSAVKAAQETAASTVNQRSACFNVGISQGLHGRDVVLRFHQQVFEIVLVVCT